MEVDIKVCCYVLWSAFSCGGGGISRNAVHGQTYMGVFREGPRGPRPPIEEIFAPFKYSLSSFLPNHVYNLCIIA